MPDALPEPAHTLDGFYSTFLPDPLRTEQERTAYYTAMSPVRGGDRALQIARRLKLTANQNQYFKGFVLGHSGVGKSTELYRLATNLEPDFFPIRFSVPLDLDASGFRPFDVLLVIANKVIEEINRRYDSNEFVQGLPARLLTDLENWYATCQLTETYKQERSIGGEAEFGLGLSPLKKLLNLAAKVKGSLRFAREREEKVTEYHMRTLTDLLSLVNRLLEEANALFETIHQQLVIIGEDFDKPGVDASRVEELFLRHKNVLSDLKVHLVFNLPISLAYSERREQLPEAMHFVIYDAPVYTATHEPHIEGRTILRDLLYKRADSTLFAADQAERLVVASGGNLRDLFQMALEAADHAALDRRVQIEAQDTTYAIQKLRKEFVDRLGISPNDTQPISYEEKITKLLAIYNQEPGSEVADLVLHSLLRARLVQEFNSSGWLGLSPMMVDVLKRHGKLREDQAGGSV